MIVVNVDDGIFIVLVLDWYYILDRGCCYRRKTWLCDTRDDSLGCGGIICGIFGICLF